jgi:hypothetical protein
MSLPSRQIVGSDGFLLQNWFQYLAALDQVAAAVRGTGPTAARPRSPFRGQMFFDETLGKPVWAKTITASTVTWVDATGATV